MCRASHMPGKCEIGKIKVNTYAIGKRIVCSIGGPIGAFEHCLTLFKTTNCKDHQHANYNVQINFCAKWHRTVRCVISCHKLHEQSSLVLGASPDWLTRQKTPCKFAALCQDHLVVVQKMLQSVSFVRIARVRNRAPAGNSQIRRMNKQTIRPNWQTTCSRKSKFTVHWIVDSSLWKECAAERGQVD